MKLTDALNQLEGEPGFSQEPVYSRSGDCLFCYFDDAESYGDRVDGILTVYRSFDDDEIVGFQIKGLTALIKRSGEFGLELETQRFKLSLLVLVSSLEGADGGHSEEERRAVYRDLATRTRDREIDAEALTSA